MHTIVLGKLHLIKNTQLTMDKKAIYSLLSKTVLEEIEFLNHATTIHLYIDKSKNVQEIEMFDAYIHTNLSTCFSAGSMLNIEHLSSEKNAGLQTSICFVMEFLKDMNTKMKLGLKEKLSVAHKKRRPLKRSFSRKS